MKLKNLFYILAAAAMFTVVSCKDEKEPEPTPTPEASITVAPTSVSVTAAGETKSLTVKATGDWTVKSSETWAKVSPDKGSKDGSVSVTVEANVGAAGSAAAAREATVSFAMGDKKVDVKVSQAAEAIVFVVSGDTAELPAAGGKVNVKVEYNETYTTESVPSWVTPATKATATDALVFDVAANEATESREGDIVFKSASGKTEKVTVKQAAAEKPSVDPNVIKSGEELAAFLQDQTRLMNSTGNYELGADIDLSGITLVMPDSLKATFDGKGYSLKNWKTENPLFKVNAGTVQNLNIDASCELKFDGAIDAERCFAFVVADNSAGLVKNCNVAGKVNVKNSTAQKIFIAGVVARQTKGKIEGCKFSGSIDVDLTNSASCSAIAGVVGRPGHVDMAGQTIVKDCVNEGNIKFVFSGATEGMKKFGVGGVVGQTPSVAGAKDKETPNHGLIEGCTNKGNIYWSYPAGGKGSYPCMGGVAGIIEGEIKGCSNYGTIEYAGSPDVAATDANFGGVAGYVTYNASDCHNYGGIKVSGTLAGGTQYAQSGGNTSYSCFGGVFGGVGPYVYDANTVIVCENCSNEAELNITPSQVTSGGPGFPIGGVVGASSAQLKNCSNTKAISVKSNTKTCFVGGIAGYATAGAEGCVNSGAITFDGDVANAPVSISGFTQQEYIAGIIGTVNQAECTFKNCKNTAPVTIVDVLDSPGVYSYAGGILGSHKQSYQVMTGCENTGDITNNAKTAISLGGLCGGINGTITDCKNSGKVIVANGDVSTKPAEIGGFIGYLNGTITGCENTGDVVNSVAGAACSGFVGGIDKISPTWTGNTVNCSVTGEASLGAVLGWFRTDGASSVLTLGAEGSPFTLKGGVASMPLCATTLTGNEIVEANVVREGVEPGKSLEIKTGEEFLAFLNDATITADPEYVVKLAGDIDLAAVTLPGSTAIACTFDGQGHSIKNLTNAEAAIFGTVTGTIKNLVFDKSCVITLKGNANTSFLALTNQGLIDGIVNNADIAMAADPSDTRHTGGLVAINRTTVQNCVNNGNVSITSTSNSSKQFRFAPFVGSNAETGDSVPMILNCVNNGNVSFVQTVAANAGARYIGGIVGVQDSKESSIVDGCVNNGKISFTSEIEGSKAVYLGGIVGLLKGGTIKNTSNFGEIANVAAGTNITAGGLVGTCQADGKKVDPVVSLTEGCAVNCKISGPAENSGLVLGTKSSTKGVQLGTDANPVKVSGSVNGVEATAENASALAVGTAFVIDEINWIKVIFDATEPAKDPDIPGVGYNDPGLTL